MIADLHTHSTASDGTLSPSALVSRAAGNGAAVLALTDHDSVEGIPEAAEAARSLNMTFVPGVELSAVEDSVDVHVLGYFIDHTDAALRSHLTLLRAARERRATAIVGALRSAGYDINVDEVLTLSSGGAVGRSHIARVLVSQGHSATISEAFERLLGRGRPFYVAKDVHDARSVVRIVREAGGLPVIAHPAVTGVVDLIEPLVAEGLAGVEVFHPEHTEAQQIELERLAGRLGLLVTGGTDFHSPEAPSPDVGSTEYPAGHLKAFLEAGA